MRIGERIPVLDSLRGVAILSVFLYHAFFWNGMALDGWLSRAVMQLTRPGWLGVDLFFVLSGFLITGRLLDRRPLAAREYYTWFYTRRALRILPLYYATLVVVGSLLWWAGETSLMFLAASAVFLPNIALIAGWWATGPLAVLWSLGVEEQVYLVWPLLVRVLSMRRLAWFFVAVGVTEPLLRWATFSSGLLPESLSIATQARLACVR
jgi:peptidoglycan/LPS O-acetylase OafA/YrhL